jgi:hypothetical protein
MSDASYVQVAPDSTGKKIRNLQLNVVQPDGSTSVVQMQVISIADANGNLMAVESVRGEGLLSTTDNRVLEELTEMRNLLGKIAQVLSLEFEQSLEDFDVEN